MLDGFQWGRDMASDIIARGLAATALRPNGEDSLVNEETGRVDLKYSDELRILLETFGENLPLVGYGLVGSVELRR